MEQRTKNNIAQTNIPESENTFNPNENFENLSFKDFMRTREFHSAVIMFILGLIIASLGGVFLKGRMELIVCIAGTMMTLASVKTIQKFVYIKNVPEYAQMEREAQAEKYKNLQIKKDSEADI